MSTSIDNRVVEMEFDNSKFDKNVKQSMNTLDELDGALKKAGSGNGLGTLESSVERISEKFSAMGVIATTALVNITNKAVDAGTNLVKSLTIDQVTAGYSKYEEKLQGVQTIMAATGADIDTVNSALDKLTWFSDETSYSFTEMTSSVGKFTSAGVSLDDAVSAMMGIANWAADAGVSTSNATSAFYNLSQAMSTGSLKMQDWKSIEGLNMSTTKFKQTAIDTAVALGKLTDVGDGTYSTLSGKIFNATSDFDSYLSTGWLDKDVLTQTLKLWSAYSDAVYEVSENYDTCADAMKAVSTEGMEISAEAFNAAQNAKTLTEAIDATKDAVSSGWMDTFELIFGNINEAKSLWTDVSGDLWDIFASGGESRNKYLTSILSSSWSQISEAIKSSGIDLTTFEEAMASIDGTTLEEINSNFDSFDSWLQTITNPSELFNKTLDSIAGTENEVVTETTDTVKSLEELASVAKDVLNLKYGSGSDRRSALTEAGYDAKQIQALATILVNAGEITEDNIAQYQKVWMSMDEYYLKQMGFDKATVESLSEIGKVGTTSYTELGESAGISADSVQALRDAINDSDSELSGLVSTMNQMSGREALFGSLFNVLESIASVVQIIKVSMSEVFPQKQASAWINKLRKMYQWTSKIAEALNTDIDDDNSTAGKLKRTFNGLLSVFGIVKDVIEEIWDGIKIGMAKILAPFNVDILEITASFGDAIVYARSWLKSHIDLTEVIVGIVDKLYDSIKKIKDWLSEIADSPEAQSFINRLTSSIAELAGKCTTLGSEAKDSVNGLFDGLVSLETLDFTSPKTAITSLFRVLGRNTSNLVLDVTTAKTAITSAVTSGLETVVTAFQNATPAIAAVLSGSVLVLSAKKLASFMDLLTGPATALKGVFTELKAVVHQLRVDNKSIQFVNFAKGLLIIAGAIMILVAAIKILADMNETDLERAKNCILELAAVLVALMAISTLLSLFIKKRGIKTGYLSIVAMASSLVLIALAMKVLDSVDISSPGMIEKFEILGGIIVAMIAVYAAMSAVRKYIGGNAATWQSALTLIAFAAAAYILVVAIKKLSSIDVTGIEAHLGTISTMIVAFGLLGSIFGLALRESKGLGFAALALSVSLIAIIALIKILNLIDWDTFLNGLFKLTLIGGILAGITAIAGVSKATIGTAATILAVAIALIAATTALYILSLIPMENIWKAVQALAVIFAGLFAMMMAAKNVSGGAKAIIAMVAPIIAAAIMLVVLSYIPWENLKYGIMSMSVILVLLAGLFASMKYMSSINSWKTVASIALIGIIIGGLVGALIALSNVPDTKALYASAVSIGGIMLVLTILFKTISSCSANATAAAPALAVMLALVVAIGLILDYLSSISNPEGLLEIATGITEVLIGLSPIVAAASLLGKLGIKGAVAGAVGIAALIALLVIEFAAIGLAYQKWAGFASVIDSALDFIKHVAEGIGEAAASFVTGFASKLPEAAENITSFISAINPMLSGISEIDESKVSGTETLKTFIANMAEVGLMLIAINVDKFKKFGEELETIGPQLSTGMSSLANFSDEDSTKISKTITALGTLMTGIGSLPTFSENTTENLQAITQELPSLGESIGNYISKLKESGSFGEGTITLLTTSTRCIQAVASIANSLPSTGISSWWNGGNRISEFVKDLSGDGESTGLADAIITYAQKVAGLTEDDVTNIDRSSRAIQYIVDLDSSLTDHGGVKGFLFGTNDLGSFATNMETLGVALKGFVENTNGITSDDVTGAKAAAEVISDLDAGLPKSSSLFQRLFTGGKESLDTFAEGMGALGAGIKDFNDAIVEGNIDTAKSLAAANVAKNVASVYQYIPESVAGSSQLSTFSVYMSSLGTGISNFSTNVSGVDFGKAKAASVSTQSIVKTLSGISIYGEDISAIKKIINYLPTIGYDIAEFAGYSENYSYSQVITGTSALSRIIGVMKNLNEVSWTEIIFKFPSYCSKLGEGIQTINTTISEVNTSRLSSISTSLDKLSSSFKTLVQNGEKGDSTVNSLFSSLSSVSSSQIESATKQWGDSFSSVISTSIGNGVNAINNSAKLFKDAGTTIMGALGSGISGSVSAQTVTRACASLVKQAATGISSSSNTTTFYNAGKNLADSLIKGLSDKYFDVYDTGYQVGDYAYKGLRDGSPWANWEAYGEYICSGLIRGMQNKSGDCSQAAYDIGQKILASFADSTGIESPSKEMRKLGVFLDKGLILGINDMAGDAQVAASEMGTKVVSAVSMAAQIVSDAVNSDMDISPTITPVLDLSNVNSASSQISRLFGQQSVNLAATTSGSINGLYTDQTGVNTQAAGATYNFTQNNYSPKALSRIDIYRQTKNQISALTGATA